MCFQRRREKEEKQGTPAETAQVSEVDPGQAGCPGAVTGLHQGVSCPVKNTALKRAGGAAWGSGHYQGISHWRISPTTRATPPGTGSEMPAGPVRDVV